MLSGPREVSLTILGVSQVANKLSKQSETLWAEVGMFLANVRVTWASQGDSWSQFVSEQAQKNRAESGPASNNREASRLGDVGLGIESQARSPSIAPEHSGRYSPSDGCTTTDSVCLPCKICIPAAEPRYCRDSGVGFRPRGLLLHYVIRWNLLGRQKGAGNSFSQWPKAQIILRSACVLAPKPVRTI